jgi:hypothetical protein
MRHYILLFLLGFAVSLTSCRNDFEFESSTGNLRFSKDTVYLDTVFTNIGSSTYTLKVYNKSNKNISIPKVQLAKGEASKYRMMVDGIPGKVFDNVELLAKDSMFIFVEVTANVIDANTTDFLYTDQILFGEGSNTQKVELVTLIQDAIFLYPQKFSNGTTETLPIGNDEIYGFYLDENDAINGNELHWTNSKPYVVYGYAAVPPNETLEVQAGARIHFHAESGLIVANNASLNVEGTLQNQVIFEGDRLEPDFAEVPGQWGTIWLTQGSTNNQLSNLTIKNATVGLLVTGNDGTSSPTLSIENTQIYNCSNVGLLARTGNIEGRNVVINNCGQTSLACTNGGSYDFTHCTFANYWSSPSQTCLVMNNEDIIVDNITTPTLLTNTNFKNCIFYGSSNLSIKLTKKGGVFNYSFKNCLIKFINSNNLINNELYDFSNNSNYIDCIYSLSYNSNLPRFENPNKNKFNILINSSVIGLGIYYPYAPKDILNFDRPSNPDLGAYQLQ